MLSRVIVKKRRGRRLLTALAGLSVVAGTFLAASTALAVHDAGYFELDGNAVNDPGTAGDDWDNVCHQVTGGAQCASASDSSATAVSWTAEADPSASIFTGGGSKDPIDVSSWAWKNAGGLPDKDNLLHAFAARYSGPPSPTCPAGTATTCDILYFGSDRFDNSGDAQQGFWFFQNKITLSNVKNGGGFAFSGVHRAGDILIISDFSNGGTVSTISIYAWDPTVSGNLRLLLSSDSANCATAGANDAACGLVNASNGTVAPWSYTDKSGNHTYLQGELYEGGINLSTLGLANECFASVASETRSSTSTTATLKDFVLGDFASCTATLTTQASTGGPVVPGATQITDTATVVGSSAANTPSGTVTFFLCSSVAAGGDCATGGSNIGTGTLSGSGATATATSPAVNTAASPLAPGHYCFRAEWPGDANYVTPLSHTNSTTECFDVKDTSGITTAQKWLPNDTATVTLGSGGTPSGSVRFDLYESADCSGTSIYNVTDSAAPYQTSNTGVYTSNTTVSWRAVFTPFDTNAVEGSTGHCETSTLTINNDTGS